MRISASEIAWAGESSNSHRCSEGSVATIRSSDLTLFAFISTIPLAMCTVERKSLLALAIFAVMCTGCGLAYNASTHMRAVHMMRSLKPGQSSLQVHQNWGEPDIRQYIGRDSQVWSYAITPNSNDVAATVLYTSVKPGDSGSFLDLKFVDGKLVSWNKAEHTAPAKQGAGFSFGVGPGGGVSNVSHF
ncbi:MAG TPA: hypothetical protein VJ728_15615 [Candidatus Binataceae bacterium]|nr:hypothetical protein [Candidatus Binataceae bacterium]